MTQVAKVSNWNELSKRRKFLYAPDVVRYGEYNIVLIGSGNREKPLHTAQAASVRNRFYGFWDEYEVVGANFSRIDATGDDCDAPGDTSLDDGCALMNTTAIFGANGAILDYYPAFTENRDDDLRGWVIDLDTHQSNGPKEQVVTNPATTGGLVYFSTFQASPPSETSCSAMGTARGYTACFLHGGVSCEADGKIVTRSDEFVGGGMPPSPVAGRVKIGDEVVPFIIGGRGPSPLEPALPSINVSSGKAKIYRYKVID